MRGQHTCSPTHGVNFSRKHCDPFQVACIRFASQMNPSSRMNLNPYAPPDVNDVGSAARWKRGRPLISFVAFSIGSIVGLNIGSGISIGFFATIQRSADNIPAAIWSFLGWAACCVAFSFPWRIGRRFDFCKSQPIPLACFIMAMQVAALFYLCAQQLDRSGLLNFVPLRMHSSVFAMLALLFGSIAVECEIALTRLILRTTYNDRRNAPEDSQIVKN